MTLKVITKDILGDVVEHIIDSMNIENNSLKMTFDKESPEHFKVLIIPNFISIESIELSS
jgi:hypothetical protein